MLDLFGNHIVGFPTRRLICLSGSTTAFDRVGEGIARPRIIRGFRPEVYSDDEDFENDKKLDRRVSFNAAKQRYTEIFDYPETTNVHVIENTQYG